MVSKFTTIMIAVIARLALSLSALAQSGAEAALVACRRRCHWTEYQRASDAAFDAATEQVS
jgi:hypothetical protein